MFAGGSAFGQSVLLTWKNLAEKVHFLLEVSMRELLVSWLHKILAGVEEVLRKTASVRQKPTKSCDLAARRFSEGAEKTDLDGVEATVLPGKLQQRHQCLQQEGGSTCLQNETSLGDKHATLTVKDKDECERATVRPSQSGPFWVSMRSGCPLNRLRRVPLSAPDVGQLRSPPPVLADRRCPGAVSCQQALQVFG